MFAYGLADDATASLALFKSRLVLPFWYRLTQVVLEKSLLNGCNSFGALIKLILKDILLRAMSYLT